MEKKAQTAAVQRDERAIFLPAKGEMNQALALLKEAILYAIQTGDYSKIKSVCKEDIQKVLNSLTELAYLKGGRRSELTSEKVVNESATEYAPVRFSRRDEDSQVQGTIDYLRRVSGLDPSLAQDNFEKHNAGAIGDLSKAIVDEVKKAVKDLVERGIHIQGGKDKIAQILAANQVGVLNTTALAETLFRTQSMQAYAAGRWNSANNSDTGRYIWGFQYVTALDNRVREGHRVLEGVRLPKEDPFWKKYFPPNGWNCRCITIELWKGDDDARIDFGITGRDPRKRTAEEMNVPPEFQGNVGIFTYKEEKKPEPEKQQPEKIQIETRKPKQEKQPERKPRQSKKEILETPASIIPDKEENPAWVPTFKNAAQQLWWDTALYVPQMTVSSEPKITLTIVFNDRGFELKRNSRTRGYLKVWRWGGKDHYTGSYSWKTIRLNETDDAGQSLDLLREMAAEVNKVEPEDIRFIVSATSNRKLEKAMEKVFKN